MSALGDAIVRLIRDEGPIPVSRYMALCLGDPRHGYYMTRDPFGVGGDFTTAPEISQMFGELIGLWAAHLWQAMGAPGRVRLVELGPGRGTLMADALRALKVVPALRAGVSVHLVETSPVLRAAQARTLSGLAEPVWHDRIETALEGPVIVLANEFLDALPLDQFVATEAGWRERLLGLGPAGELAWGLSGETVARLPGARAGESGATAPGTVFEQPQAALDVVAALSRHVAQAGGGALFIDYGATASGFGDTLQAVKAHRFVEVLAEPGEADLTVHVDFARMARAGLANGAAAHGPATQGDFLLALGLAERARALAAKATPAQSEAIATAAARLTERGETGMGDLFKVLALSHPALPPLPGFDLHRLPERT